MSGIMKSMKITSGAFDFRKSSASCPDDAVSTPSPRASSIRFSLNCTTFESSTISALPMSMVSPPVADGLELQPYHALRSGRKSRADFGSPGRGCPRWRSRSRRAKGPPRAPALRSRNGTRRSVPPKPSLSMSGPARTPARGVHERALGIPDLIRRAGLRAARRARDVDRRVDPVAADRRQHRRELFPIGWRGRPGHRVRLALFP